MRSTVKWTIGYYYELKIDHGHGSCPIVLNFRNPNKVDAGAHRPIKLSVPGPNPLPILSDQPGSHQHSYVDVD